MDVANNRTLLVLGRLDAEKGVMLAAAAAQQAGLPIVFAGDGPLRARGGGGRRHGHRLAGRRTAYGRHWRQARCLVFPSRWYETFGLVVEEAAARGVPAIVSDVCRAVGAHDRRC